MEETPASPLHGLGGENRLEENPGPALTSPDLAMAISKIIDFFGYAIYGALALLAVWGVYNAILLYRALGRKSIGKHSEALIRQVGELCKAGKIDAATSVCQGPPYWHTALAQLMAVALTNRSKGLGKIKQILVLEFHTEVIAALENRLATISTIVRMGPLLGLLGTVASMIGAFGRIGGAEKVAPSVLANDISLALWATGSGLLIATPLMIVGNDIHAKLRYLRDLTERQLQDFLEVLEEIESQGKPVSSQTRPVAARAVLPR
jgi:biopolymer transport protein ExbB